MISAYQHKDLEEKINRDAILLNSLARTYNMLKLMPYPEIQQTSFSLNPKVVDIKKMKALEHACFDFSHVVANLYSNIDSLCQFYREYASEDEFLGLVLKLHDRIKSRGVNLNKPIVFLNRNDFMYDQTLEKFQQIEYNLIAPTQGFNCQNTTNLLNHYYSLQLDTDLPYIKTDYDKFSKEAFSKFMSYYANPNAYVGIVIMEPEANMFEIIQLEHVLLDAGIKSIRIPISDISKTNYLVDESNNLFFKGKELAIVYYRCFYDPSHYSNQSEDFIVTAEVSNAMCIPTMDLLLINMKLNQLLLYNESLLIKYLPKLDLLSFQPYLCPHYSLAHTFNNDKELMIEEVEKNIDSYIVKTFKEGGNCDIIAGRDILDLINSKSNHELNAYMLVRKVKTPVYPSYVWNAGQLVYLKESISELGIFTSAVITKDKDGVFGVEWQKGGEYLLKSKASSSLKGGIMINVGFIDSLITKDNL